MQSRSKKASIVRGCCQTTRISAAETGSGSSSVRIKKYHEDNSNVAFGEFKFGPLFMRLCYELGLEEMAAATLTDKDMRGFFSDSTSFNIAIDMLFMKGLYESSLDVLRDMKNQGVPFNKDTFTLATGTCYKLNTPESYRICTALIEEEQTKGHIMPRHAYCFTVALPLRQNDVERAQSMFCQIMSTDSRICQYLKVLILAMAGAVKESLSVLTLALGSSSPAFIKKPEFTQEVRGQSSDGESGAGSVPPPAGRSGESTKRGRDVVSYPHGEEEDAHGDNGRETDQPEDSEASAVHSVVRVNGTRCISQRV
nr:pentatricopeptide repeat-containing protein 2, mitochondrial-like isoform X1 [Salvelinus alpinus]XP_023840113.1 pentatricopeptide repeat-containing protein 2, mitochondrial-like isoform X1 [Salvelinus alpinus]